MGNEIGGEGKERRGGKVEMVGEEEIDVEMKVELSICSQL
jgi:hypothetical protein